MKKLLRFLVFSCMVLLCCILLIPVATSKKDTIKNPASNDSNHATTIKDDIEAPSETEQTEIQEKPVSILLIGNSYFYYNNVPEMVYNFAKEGTGKSIELVSCSLNGHTLREQANAINTLLRTKGNIKNLKAEEKKYFISEKTTGEREYADFVYERYADIFWDYEHDCMKQYDYVVLSPVRHEKYGDGSSTSLARAMSEIISDVGTENTRFVLHYTHARMEGDLDDLLKEQSRIDKLYDKAIEIVESDQSLSDKFSAVSAAKAGRANCNYLLYYGTRKAIETEKDAYNIYRKYLAQYGYKNDLYLGESEHLTVLGSYIMAASIYEAMFGQEDDCLGTFDVSKNYCGKTTKECKNLKFENSYDTNYGLYYNKGDGFKTNEICRAAAFIVEQTQWKGMEFSSKADATHWKEDETNVNYDY